MRHAHIAHGTHVRLVVRAWLCVLFFGCAAQESTPETSPDASPDTTLEGGVAGVESAGEGPYARFVEDLNPRLREILVERAARDDFQRGLQARLQQAVETYELRRKLPEGKQPPRDLHYESTLMEVYAAAGFKPMMTTSGRLTPEAYAIFEIISDAAAHGLDPQEYWVDALTDLVERSNKLSSRLDEAPGLMLFEQEAWALRVYLALNGFNVGDELAQEKVVEMLLSAGADNPVPRLRGAYDLYRNGQGKLLELAVELEARTADAYVRYARDMAHGNLNRLTTAEREKYGDDVHPKYHSEIVLARLKAELETITSVQGAEAATAHIKRLWPQHEQYGKTREAYARYKEIAEKGGWPKVEPTELTRGGRAPTVVTLKQRLSAESYYEGTIDDFYDDDLTDAIALYQETHQVEITGEPNAVFWRSVNISAETRFKQIEANMQLWRESRMVASDYYVYINVPDFHAEVWRGGERAMRFKIVVGNTQKVCDVSTNRWKYVNATPLQHAKVQYLIFNPYWNVPPRIARDEYAPQIEADARWLDKNGFEFHRDKAGGTVLRQIPGVDNALGAVKFIFPNKYNTYMHDTPKREFFNYPIRAFSHGCMRVEDPLELAEFILEHEGKWNDKVVLGYLKQNDETQVDLDTPIDVFVEYYTIRVDEFGRVHFLADIYDYVRDAFRPTPNGCTVETDDGPAIPKGADFGP